LQEEIVDDTIQFLVHGFIIYGTECFINRNFVYITETIKEETLKIGFPVAMLQMVDAHLPIVPG